MKRIICTSLLLLAAGSPALCQKNKTPISNASQLDKPTPVSKIENVSTEDAMARVLREANIAGGIVSVKACKSDDKATVKHYFDFSGLTLRQALDRITADDSNYKWAWDGDSILLLPSTGTPQLLQTKINHFDAEDVPFSAADGVLFNTPEVKQRMADLKLSEYISDDMIVSIGGGSVTRLPRTSMDNLTFMEALNTIARGRKNSVWRYVQFQCQDKGYYSFDWPVRH